MGRHMRDLAGALVAQEVRLLGEGATREAVEAAAVVKIKSAIDKLVVKQRIGSRKEFLVVKKERLHPILKDAAGYPWFRFPGTKKEDFLNARATKYVFGVRNFPVAGNWRALVSSLCDQRKMTLCSPPKYFADRSSDYFCWTDKYKEGVDYSKVLKDSNFDYLDSKIAEAFMQEESLSAVLLTGGRIPLSRINSRFRLFEKAGMILQVDRSDFWRGNFRPKWFRATDKLRKIMGENLVDYDFVDDLDFED